MSIISYRPYSVLIFNTVWLEFNVKTIYERTLDVYITNIKANDHHIGLYYSYTDSGRDVRRQHLHAFRICLKIIELASGEDDF